ncbi:phage late control D family protein [Clostridium neonatale]|uniref:phage late control D family protein n=1 Tax=Clostridium neonatale TaxID=137838 RepID=UPI001DD3D476|nr:hypothetical protein [Clostridium neonatale]CAG9710141.1 conserved hypothetical protein [Clostridium neonatale]
MKDLMNSSKINFKDFVTKYNNFMVPSYDISIDGTSITKDKLIISEIKVELSTKDKAGIGIFKIKDCYDYQKKGFKKEITSKIKLGKKVDILLGYSGKNTVIFKGYIESINYEFNDSQDITVVCMDAIHILMQNFAIEQKGKDKALSVLVTEILNKQKGFISESDVGNISSTGMQVAQNVSDYDFIRKIASENGFEFFIIAGKAYFRKAQKLKTPITTITYGESVLSFEREVKYKNVKIIALGKDDNNKKTTKGVAVGKTKGTNIANAFVSNKIIISGNLNTDDKAKKRAEVEVEKIISEAYYSKLQCIGIPEIMPGRYIELKDFDSEIDNQYYITKVCHEFTPGEYVVTLNLSTND